MSAEAGWEELRREIEALEPVGDAGFFNPRWVSRAAVLAIVDLLAATRGEPPEPLRAALDRIPKAVCYRTHLDSDDHRGVFGAVWLADVGRVLTAARLLPLDDAVDLAALLHDNDFSWDDANAVNAVLTHHGLVVCRAVTEPSAEPPETP